MGAPLTATVRERAGSLRSGLLRPAGSLRFRFKKPGILPGFGISLGFAVTYLSLIVLIPLSAIIGAVVLLAADVGARSLVDNADLPLGMLTSLIGGPFFFWLLRRTRARAGGWA